MRSLAPVRRVAAALASAAVGAATGIATVAVHDWWWGLALAAVTTVLAALALPPGWSARLAYGLGWDGLVGWLTVPRPEGDYVISADVQGYAVLGLGLVLLVGCVATLPRPARRGPEASPGYRAGTTPAR